MGGDIETRDKPRNLRSNRVCVTLLCLIFLIAVVSVPLYFYLSKPETVQFPCHEDLSVPLLSPVYHSNGSVVDGEDVYPAGYHFTRNGSTRGCLCVLKPCIRKCCGKEEHLVKVPESRARCERFPGPRPFDDFSLPVHKSPGELVAIGRDHFRVLYGDVCRLGKYRVEPDELHLSVDGILLDALRERSLDVSGYCLDSMNGSEEIRMFACFQDSSLDDEERLQFLLYPIAMMVSIPFLVATIAVYSIIPELRNLHGKCLVCQCSCLLLTYIGLAIIQLTAPTTHNVLCVSLAIMVQFTFLGAFFWLNVMSFDIWWSLSGLRPAKWGVKAAEHQRFLLYSLYAWGAPLGIAAITVGMDIVPGISDTFIRPRFGELNCWFADWEGQFLYFYLPTGVLLILNTVMFVTTAFKLQSHTDNDRDRVRFCLYMKLFLLMGLNWTLELLSFFVGGPKSMWFVTDLSNILQGVVIFFFFVCKREILQKLNKKLCPNWILFQRPTPGLSNSLSSSISLTKTENEILGLTSINNRNGDKHEDTQPQVT